ncbi:acyltransferase [Photobacterium nomapromontoriensis]|uniref:acyltransferase n=1 Tax=Photobacterium nomapromontoriensis TaxID=2910237 RepID=UPI003D125A0F
MPCVYENIYPISKGITPDDIRISHQQQIHIDKEATFVGLPHIAFTLVRDSDNYQRDVQSTFIELTNFNDTISIGKGTVLYSDDNLGFENRPVRLTSIQVNNHPPGKIRIGEGVVMQGTAIVAYSEISIGDQVLFGPQVTIMDSSGHPVIGRWTEDEAARTRTAKVTIKDNAWIGMGATILKGVTIGKNAVIGANSVVYDDVPDNCIAVGNPAYVVKNLTVTP